MNINEGKGQRRPRNSTNTNLSFVDIEKNHGAIQRRLTIDPGTYSPTTVYNLCISPNA